MTATATATAEVAPWVERLARIGYAAKALLYMTVGYLAAQAALGRGGRVTDTQGALRTVNQGGSAGWIVLLVIAAGLLGYALWRLVEAVVDPERRGTGFKAIAVRLGFAVRGLFHGALGVTALRLALHQRGGSSGQVRDWTRKAFELPGGEVLVLLAAAGIAGYGIYQFYRAVTPKMKRHLQLGELPNPPRNWVVGISRFGIAARGVVFCLVGFFLVRAAVGHDVREAGGLREALRAVAGAGRWPFLVVAFGLIAYGVYELLNARYRSIRVTA
jgi:hypothetical protein